MNMKFRREDGAWAQKNQTRYGMCWLHSDMHDMSYFRNRKLFETLVEKGDLK